ncbi:MAG: hypothetical protein KDF63_09865 [Rhodoferax sp.]|nr:hypothetical protein [Rhodoferax sp.]
MELIRDYPDHPFVARHASFQAGHEEEPDMTAAVLNSSLSQPRGTEARPFWARVWAAAESYGQRRALTELRRLSQLHGGTDPDLRLAVARLAERVEGGASR